MIRRRPPAPTAGMQDVETDEGGEPPMEGASGDESAQALGLPAYHDSDAASGDAGSTTGAGSLQLEIDILSAAAIERIAGEIARRAAKKASAAKIRSVTIASPVVVAFLRFHAAIEAEIATLESIADRLAKSAVPDFETVEAGDTTALAIPAVGAATEGARRVLSSAAAALRTFAVRTSYSGRAKVARQPLLDAALAKHLSSNGFDVEIPERGPGASEPHGLFGRILRLQTQCRDLQEEGIHQSESVLSAIDSLVSVLFGTPEEPGPRTPLSQQLIIADGIARGAGRGKALLFAEIAFSGGSYRTRKWIFNYLLGKDGLTYNGGAGVTYFLFRADDRSAIDSDTVYFALPHGRFRHAPTGLFPATNIEG